MAEFQTKDKGVTFQEIIWKTIESLREKASSEYRTPQEKMIVHSNWTEKVLEGDCRKEFNQLVEFLSDILSQEFDKDTYDKYKEIVDEVKKERDKQNKGEIELEDFIIYKVEKMRELLRLIMFQIKTKDYLKGFGSTKEDYRR